MSQRANVIADTFSAVGKHITESTNQAARAIGDNTRELNELLESRSSEMIRILDETARPLADRFTAGGSELERSIEAAAEKATQRLRSENSDFIEALETQAGRALAAAAEARNTITDSVDQTVAKVADSNRQLSELAGLAEQSLGTVDRHLNETTQAFAASTERAAQTFASSARLLDSNTTRLTTMTSETLKAVASIASRFDEHSQLLSSASDLLGSAQTNLVTTLGDRQNALEDLAVGLVRKSEDIEKIMRSFENLVMNSFANAETRAQDTTETIRKTLSSVIDGATQRFADATVDLRKTAETIRNELDDTRNALKKGIVDMPVEARESTSAIRRAVTEQINALKELSAIVVQSGRTMDVSEPERSVIRRPVSTTETRLAERFATPAEPEEVKLPLRGSISEAPQLKPKVPNAPQPANPAPAAPAGDVATAPRVEAAGPATRLDNTLGSLAKDIAKSIDTETLSEIWERRDSGRALDVSRRLYTLRGQQIFDEVTAKYRRDDAFRVAVDRYCDDFERLLDRVSRTEGGKMKVRNYEMSDTGKAYIMLAHASGRLT